MNSLVLRSPYILAALLTFACANEGAENSSAGGEELSQSLLTQGPSSPVIASQGPLQEGPLPVEVLGYDRGSTSAPVKVVELSDYGCGYCRRFHQESFPSLREEFIETGMVEWKFAPYITGMFENSMAATEAAECANVQDPAAFEALNLRLWDEQSAWKGSGDAEALVRGWAEDLDLDMAAYDACIAEDTQMSRIVSSTLVAQRLGVRGTPTFLVLGFPPVQGALPLETFRELLGIAYEELTRAPAPGRP